MPAHAMDGRACRLELLVQRALQRAHEFVGPFLRRKQFRLHELTRRRVELVEEPAGQGFAAEEKEGVADVEKFEAAVGACAFGYGADTIDVSLKMAELIGGIFPPGVVKLKQGGGAVRITGSVGKGILLDRPPLDNSTTDTDEDKEAVVIGRAEALAAAAVRGLGGDYRDLKSVSTDLDNIKIRRRQH